MSQGWNSRKEDRAHKHLAERLLQVCRETHTLLCVDSTMLLVLQDQLSLPFPSMTRLVYEYEVTDIV